MNILKLNEERIFQNHSKETIKRWIESFKYFNYLRARQGHSCEGDTFSAHFSYKNKEEIVHMLGQLGVQLKPLEEGCIPYHPTASIYFDQLDKIKYTIPNYDNYEQPQNTIIQGIPSYVWVQENCIEISISGNENNNAYQVAEVDFQLALKLEETFDKLNWKNKLDNEIKKQVHCISKELYPEYL